MCLRKVSEYCSGLQTQACGTGGGGFASSAYQLGCTDVPGVKIISQNFWSPAELVEGIITCIVFKDTAVAQHNMIKPDQNCECSHNRKQLHVICG
jgi:hypothetical protein